jgi:predicted CopG family antitoxin
MNEHTTIAVSKDVRDDLASLGRKGESFNEIVLMLIRSFRNGGGC